MTRPLILAVALAAACAGSHRPAFEPEPEAGTGVVELTVPDATRRLADALKAEKIPVSRVEPDHGFLESPWFDTATGHPVHGRALGPRYVRVRAWITPWSPEHAHLAVEAVYRAWADPSRPPRDLERSVAYDHPTRVAIRAALAQLSAVVIVPEPEMLAAAERERAATADSLRRARDSLMAAGRAPADTAHAPRPDTAHAPRPDTGAAALRHDTTGARRDTAALHVESARVRPDTAPRQRADTAVARPSGPPPVVPPAVAAPRAAYSVQVVAASARSDADSVAAALRAAGYSARIVREGRYWKVRTRIYVSAAEAARAAAALRGSFPGAFVTREP